MIRNTCTHKLSLRFLSSLITHFTALLMHIGGPVVCVDWGHMADGKFGPDALRTLLYPFIVDNVATVGEYVGEFVVFLKNNSVISSYDQVHVIGFSLGGHVSGIAGWTVQNRTNGEKLGRITGKVSIYLHNM